MPDTLSPRARSRTARARAATHNPVRPVRSHRWSALRSPRVSRSGPARRPPFFMRCRVSHGWATLGSNFRDTALDRVRAVIRARHYSRRTEGAYVAWIRRYILFHDKRHPTDMGAPEITRFLSSLAVEGNVAASTQNQALSALLFLYRDVLEVELPWLDGIVRAKRPQRLPVVLTRDEVRALLQRLEGAPRLMAYLLYGAGLRLLECCRLRVQDVDFGSSQIVVRAGKGDKDRVTMLPATVRGDLVRQVELAREHDRWLKAPRRIGRRCHAA